MDVRLVCGLALTALILGLSVFASAESLTVETKQGKVRGKTINNGKVKAFLGLPYAAAPVGDLRWKPPAGPANWTGERDATKYGAHCAQNQVFDDMVFQDGEASEDCLFLNVYAPANATSQSKLPVMFWIHGGGFAGGASSEPRHNGDFLPLKGVVLVTINYRLGVFGFLATEDLAQEADGASGNYGLLDMVAALQWVKSNIKQFGGNPDNVTIFGESAGSAAVSTLMASPIAKGLFHRAIGESGGALGEGLLDYQPASARAKTDGEWVAKTGAKSLKELRALPTAAILEAAKSRGMVGFGPDIDGKLLVEPVRETYAAGRQAHVPLLAGWNRDEGSFFVMGGMTAEKFKAMAAGMFKDRAEEFLKLYPADNDEQAMRSAIDFGSDQFIAFGTWKWLEAHRKTGQSPVYRYHFELAAPPSKFHPGSFAFHSDDIEYVFGTLDTRPGAVWREEDRKLSDEIMDYWTNFAKKGDPNGAGLPEWPQYGQGDALIHLDSTITSGPDTLRPRYEFLLKGLPPMRF
ncbi:MAG TPA: carboxylesterase family protein [Terriglobales bacterium]|jgi:para-nitrobenzyl esterase|nr:carboxylesterase family protein [Terriglobales bacterium]